MEIHDGKTKERRLPWTPEEDHMLIEYIENINDDHSYWTGVAVLARLKHRSGKSCWERWNNHLKPGLNKANFSQEEDDTIIRLHSCHGNRWAFIRDNHLPWRIAKDIKNRRNNHLKNRLPI